MARPGIKTSLFDYLARRRLRSSNVLLLGVNNAYPVLTREDSNVVNSIHYYGADTETIWIIRRLGSFSSLVYEVKRKNLSVYKYMGAGVSDRTWIQTPRLDFTFHKNGEMRMVYNGRMSIFIQRVVSHHMLKVIVTVKHRAIRRRLRLPFSAETDWIALYKYCYDLLIQINGGPLES